MSVETREHTFDGIQEFDNRLPNWWLWTFYLACIFSVIYWVHYHTLGTGNLPGEQFEIDQAAAAAAMEERMKDNPVTNESLLKLASEPSFVNEGKALFQNVCIVCHRANGGAGKDASGYWGTGGNLTDDSWIYGGEPMDIYKTIMDGRTPSAEIGSTGVMPPHKSYGLGFVQRVTAFVLSIKNTNVKGGKPPESYAKKAK